MLKFYRQFLPHAAAQEPLHDLHASPGVKSSDPITWMPELLKAFGKCKESLQRATLLAQSDLSLSLVLVTDASTSAMGAVLQQRVEIAWQAFVFSSKKLNPARQK